MRINIFVKLMTIVIILSLGQLILIGILINESKQTLDIEAKNRLEIQKQQVEIQGNNFRDLIDSMHTFTGANIETNIEIARKQFEKECGTYVEKINNSYLVCPNSMIIEDTMNDNSLVQSIKNIVRGHASIFVDLENQTAKKISTTVTEGQYVYGFLDKGAMYETVILQGKSVIKYTKVNGVYKTKACDPLRNKEGKIVGELCVGIPEAPTLDMIKNKVKEVSFGKAGRIILIDVYEDRYGEIIYHPELEPKTNVAEKEHIKEMLANQKEGFNFHDSPQGKKHIAHYTYYEPYDMLIITENELIDEQTISSNKIVALSLTLLIISIIVALIFSRTISKPIIMLKKAADDVTSGKFDVKLPHNKISDEISDLGASLEMLITAFKMRRQAEKDQEEQKKKEIANNQENNR